MVKHYVFWNFNEKMSEDEKAGAGQRIKESLEAIKDKVAGVISIKVLVNELDSSNRDLALLSVFETVDALNAYQVHPEHLNAGAYIKTVTCNRTCFDFREE